MLALMRCCMLCHQMCRQFLTSSTTTSLRLNIVQGSQIWYIGQLLLGLNFSWVMVRSSCVWYRVDKAHASLATFTHSLQMYLFRLLFRTCMYGFEASLYILHVHCNCIQLLCSRNFIWPRASAISHGNSEVIIVFIASILQLSGCALLAAWKRTAALWASTICSTVHYTH